jgi:hypothetical protein
MTDPKLTCSIYAADHIAVRRDVENGRLVFECRGDDGLEVEVFVRPPAIREFLRIVGAMADEIDGEEHAAPASALKVGDRFRVTKYRLESAAVEVGEVVTVQSICGSSFQTDGRGREGERRWHFGLENIGNGLERVDAVGVAGIGREALVTRAKALLEGTAHTGADVIAMAAFLEGE